MGLRSTIAGLFALAVGALGAGAVSAQSDTAARVQAHLYAGSFAEGHAELAPLAEGGDSAAAFGLGVLSFFEGIEGLAQALYRHGFNPPRGLGNSPFLGIAPGPVADRPEIEPLSYEQLRDYLETFVTNMDTARGVLLEASDAGSFAVEIDVLEIRVDIDGNGTAEDGESVGAFLARAAGMAPTMVDVPEAMRPPVSRFAFDTSDVIWLAGYSNVLAVQADFLLAHDFETFFDAVMHRIFPGAGLPMESYVSDGELFMDRDSDSLLADAIAAIHTINWPVEDPERLVGVQDRLLEIFALSRRNWASILSETDDHLEFIPAPGQTALHEGMVITKSMVEAWLETLDVSERIVTGQLLLPHWRYSSLGFDLDAYFNGATRTDFVMLFTGRDSLPFLREGSIADAQSFAAANAVFGSSIFDYAVWFN